MKTKNMLVIIGLLPLLLCGCMGARVVPSNEFSGMIGNQPFKFSARKQTTAKGIEILSEQGTNRFALRVQELSSTNDPQVIDKSYAGQAAVIDAQARFVEKVEAAIGKAAGAAANTAVTGK